MKNQLIGTEILHSSRGRGSSLCGAKRLPVRDRIAVVALIASFLMAWPAGNTVEAQLSGNPLTDVPTQERLQQPGWWPTKPLSLQDRRELVGSQTCSECHSDIATTQRQSEMARTLTLAGTAGVAQHLQDATFDLGKYRYTLETSQGMSRATASDGRQSTAAPIQWVFGSGAVGQTYYWDDQGGAHESRFSYFNSTHSFNYTPGFSSPDSVEVALGRTLSNAEARTCFACHATVLTEGKPESVHDVMAGIGCETCHGPGSRHIAALNASDAGFRKLILNPGRLSPAESVNFCGACHRTSADIELMGITGVATVRFPAFRLQESRCWGQGSAKLTCVACHDPHKPLVREAEFYDRKCLACHRSSPKLMADANHPGAACPVASQRCVSCHMPKYKIADMNSSFTDHRIRVAHAAEAFPE